MQHLCALELEIRLAENMQLGVGKPFDSATLELEHAVRHAKAAVVKFTVVSLKKIRGYTLKQLTYSHEVLPRSLCQFVQLFLHLRWPIKTVSILAWLAQVALQKCPNIVLRLQSTILSPRIKISNFILKLNVKLKTKKGIRSVNY